MKAAAQMMARALSGTGLGQRRHGDNGSMLRHVEITKIYARRRRIVVTLQVAKGGRAIVVTSSRQGHSAAVRTIRVAMQTYDLPR